jgi:large subunit ribosomal protein L13
MHTTPLAKPGEIVPRWYLVDASQEVLGRAATRIARMLQGKHRPTYTPHVDTGDFVVVINAEKVQATGKKDLQKQYTWYTGWPGGLKRRPLGEMRRRNPAQTVRLAVRRMLPKSTLGRNMLKKLKIYPGPDHPHAAQKPEAISFGTGRGGR